MALSQCIDPLRIAGLVCLTLLATASWLGCRSDRGASDSATYDTTVARFYRGLAALEVGLLDDAISAFADATDLAPTEPAVWANRGLAHARLGDAETAAEHLARARALVPDDARVALLQGLLDGLRGRLDEGLTHLRAAVDGDPNGIRTRYALAQAVERAGGPNSDVEAISAVREVLDRAPNNLAAQVEAARLATRLADAEALEQALDALRERAEEWPAPALDQLEAVRQAAATANYTQAATAIAFLRNVLLRTPAFQESLSALSVPPELIGDPFTTFVAMDSPVPASSPPDLGIEFTPMNVDTSDATWSGQTAVSPDGVAPPVMFVATDRELRQVDPAVATTLSTRGGVDTGTGRLLALDWNHDFRMDLAWAGVSGVRLLVQTDDGSYTDVTDEADRAAGVAQTAVAGVWSADVEMDGDLDLVVGAVSGPPLVLRNNGDLTWRRLETFGEVDALRGFAWGDLDADGDPDAALLDAAGVVHVYANQQGSVFRRWTEASTDNVDALSLGDINADGRLDLVLIHTDGQVRQLSTDSEVWNRAPIAEWAGRSGLGGPGLTRVWLVDLDNNGGLDLLGTETDTSRIWLSDETLTLTPLPTALDAEIFSVIDRNGDGRLDLAALADGQPVWLDGEGTRPYRWHLVRPQAQPEAGDQRINSFGLGGEISVRAGLLVQTQVMSGGPVHFGLGDRSMVDVVRIVWPNGVMQAEFDLESDQVLVANQRLKGSCPWVFADDGTNFRFVTDFLWRSPLGLRINAQDTAGVTQTEDWVKIRGDQLVARDGRYEIRITAELWETHFFDHVSLMTVDHPVETEVFVDERFARDPAPLKLYATRAPRPVAHAWDNTGADVTKVLQRRDGQHLAITRGQYQGIAGDHVLEFALDHPIPDDRPTWLLAHGWVYPTDSSINVAVGQGRHAPPRGLALEVQDETGHWGVVHPDLGFPAGKEKTIVVDLRPAAGAGVDRRLRLRTNLEVYWDWLATADGLPTDHAQVQVQGETQVRTTRLTPASADLRYRGFSVTHGGRPPVPEIPTYETLGNVTPRWRDLEGYHTRFGDVRELLNEVDDRYVIMNAGDELRLQFPDPGPVPDGFTRDFVLIGDGWVKDGDYNTQFSRTVRPLPAHDLPDYGALPWPLLLEDDPVYRRHPDDWRRFHTRFVSPRRYLRGLHQIPSRTR